MTVPRPYEANLGPKNAIFDFSKFAEIFLIEKLCRPGRDRIPAGRSRELNRRPGRPGEGQGGPNKGHRHPKIGQNLRTKKNPDWSAAQPCNPGMRLINYCD